MGEVRYLSAREAARELGVSLPTLYAYVSRGLLGRERSPDGRTSTFDPAEIIAAGGAIASVGSVGVASPVEGRRSRGSKGVAGRAPTSFTKASKNVSHVSHTGCPS